MKLSVINEEREPESVAPKIRVYETEADLDKDLGRLPDGAIVATKESEAGVPINNDAPGISTVNVSNGGSETPLRAIVDVIVPKNLVGASAYCLIVTSTTGQSTIVTIATGSSSQIVNGSTQIPLHINSSISYATVAGVSVIKDDGTPVGFRLYVNNVRYSNCQITPLFAHKSITVVNKEPGAYSTGDFDFEVTQKTSYNETLLWTNPNPTSIFNNQGILIPTILDYDKIVVTFTDDVSEASPTALGSSISEVNTSDKNSDIYGYISYIGPTNKIDQTYISRRNYRIHNIMIDFFNSVSTSFKSPSTVEIKIENTRQIPYQIFGIKKTR